RHRQERQALPDLGGKLRLHRALLLSVLVFCPWGLCPWLPLVVPWWLTDRSVACFRAAFPDGGVDAPTVRGAAGPVAPTLRSRRRPRGRPGTARTPRGPRSPCARARRGPPLPS